MQRLSASFRVAAIPVFTALTLAACSPGTPTPPASNPTSIAAVTESLLGVQDEADADAPIDYGVSGAPMGVSGAPMEAREKLQSTAGAALALAIPAGGSSAATTGTFGAAVTWPIIPIHVVLLPDGRVMNYGTTQTGAQGAQLVYDVWDPALGTGTNAHLVLPNTTPTDIFCGTQSVLLSGDVLLAGGDLTINGQRNFARSDTNLFSPSTNTLTVNTPMSYARWYGSLVALPDGRLVIFGGYQNATTLTPVQPATTPELYDPATRAWAQLPGATNLAAFGGPNWFYPRAFLSPGGKIFSVGNQGKLFTVSVAGAGSIVQASGNVPVGDQSLPTVPFAPGKLLSLRQNRVVVVIDHTHATPVVKTSDPIDQVRLWASGTVMADGRVLITGGSTVKNNMTGAAYIAQIWDPATGHWTAGAVATKPRLYHSISLLLPDATVLTGAGGAPGPVKNLNAEIYYPSYLYASNGAAAVRPVIQPVASRNANVGGTISVTTGALDTIQRVTFVRTGSDTHAYNSDQRFLNLSFTQDGQSLTAVLPGDPTVLVPGYYMLFAFNSAGVPSTALIYHIS